MAKKATKKAAKKKTEIGSFLVASKVRAYIKAQGGRTPAEVLEALNQKVCCLLDAAIARAKSNKRTTVRPSDL